MSNVEVAAYYFPNYHTDPRNSRRHGEGWTEWNLVRTATPRYPGHRQPKVPAWGYFDESDPAWAAKEIDLAADHGITSFIYDWYYYNDGPFLNDGLDRGFLNAANTERMKFALMWANHDWTDIHPARHSNKPEVLYPGKVTAETFDRIADLVAERYFSRRNYWRIDGKPYFSIYELGTFIAGLGGLDRAAAAVERFRQRTGGVHLNAVVWQLPVLPGEMKLGSIPDVLGTLGVDSATSYTWIHHYYPNQFGFPRGSYAAAAEANYPLWDRYQRDLPVPYHPNVSMGWDSSPRTVQSDVFEDRGYPFTAVLEGNTPAAFREALVRVRAYLERVEVTQKVFTINAWNEWTEGSYLLPDTVTGNAYLEAIRDVFR